MTDRERTLGGRKFAPISSTQLASNLATETSNNQYDTQTFFIYTSAYQKSPKDKGSKNLTLKQTNSEKGMVRMTRIHERTVKILPQTFDSSTTCSAVDKSMDLEAYLRLSNIIYSEKSISLQLIGVL